MPDNPYADAQYQNPYSIQQAPGSQNLGPDNYCKQIPIVGILQIVQAGLELMVCVLLAVMSFAMAAAANDPKFQEAQRGNPAASPEMLKFIFIALAVGLAFIGLLRLTAGVLTLMKRGRIFTLVVSVVGLASVFTVYCSLTSIAVAIYTLVILIQPSVIETYRKAHA